jgi:hypothetical protein
MLSERTDSINFFQRHDVSGPALAEVTQRIGEPQLYESLPCHADAFGFAVNRPKQVDWKVDVHTLDFPTRTASFREIEMSGEVFSTIVHFVETRSRQTASLRGSALLPPNAPGGPR